MTIQWPSESEDSSRQFFSGHPFDPKDELRRIVNTSPLVGFAAFDQTIDWIVQQGDETIELEHRMNAVGNDLGLADVPEIVNLLMAWSCAEALAKTPSLQTWKSVRKLKSNSWALDHWLFDAMLVCAEKEGKTKDAYVKLAKEVIEALDSGVQLLSQFDRCNTEREQFRTAWDQNGSKLEEIWWGLRGWHGIGYEEEFPLFNVLAALDSSGFIDIASRSRNPYLVNSTLWAAGVPQKFGIWENLSAAALPAFVDDGTWNASVALPLLLVIARNQLLQDSSRTPAFNPSDSETEKVERKITELAKAVVATLDRRLDALPLFARWSTWLMRQLLTKGGAHNVRSSAFVDAALIEAIGYQLQGKPINREPPFGVPAWEKWCYRCVLSSHAHSGFIPVPSDYDSFLKEWAITLDDWTDTRGRQLRERASLIMTINKAIPGDAAHLLAFPIAMSESPVDTWRDLWDVVQTLREIVEFGAVDALGSDEYATRVEAGGLLFLVFCIGLAILDQRASQCRAGSSPQARDLAKLHEGLAFAVQEMREIDDTLNAEKWLDAVQHLAVRRLIWEDRGDEVKKEGRFPIFVQEDKPTFGDYLRAARNDVMELLAIVRSALLNGSDRQIVLDRLRCASIDLSNVIATAKQLNYISPNRYPIDEEQLRSLIPE